MAKQHLIERFSVNKESIKQIPLTEATKVIEKDGEKLKCRAAYEIPVWRLGEKNLNERIYGKELAEKLIKDQPTTLGLANHPKEEADVTYTFAVEKNPHIKENILFVDAYFVGPHGDLANEVIEAGGSIGLSSSAYGDVADDGTILQEGFEIERFADWVDMPSYQVYAGTDNKIDVESAQNKEKKEEVITNIKEENKKFDTFDAENNKEISVMNKIEEKNLKIGVRNLFKEAEAKEDLKERKQAFQEVLDYCEGVDFANEYTEKAKENINSIEKELYELANKGKELDKLKEDSEKSTQELTEEVTSLKKSLETLQEEYDTACELLDQMKERESKIKELYDNAVAEKNGMVTADEYSELYSYMQEKEKELEESQEEVEKLKEKIKLYRKKAAESVTKQVEKGDKEDKDMDEEGEEEEKCDKKKKDEMEKKKKSDDEEDENEENEENEEKKKESSLNFRNDKQVQSYYRDLVSKNPNVEKIRDEILSCKTVFEAQRKYLKFSDLLYDIPNPKKQFAMSEIEKRSGEAIPRETRLPLRKGWD